MPKGIACSGFVWHLQKWQVPFCCQNVAVQVSSNKHCNACSALLMPHFDPKHVNCSGKCDCGYSKISPHTQLIKPRVMANTLSITTGNVSGRLCFPLDGETATEKAWKFTWWYIRKLRISCGWEHKWIWVPPCCGHLVLPKIIRYIQCNIVYIRPALFRNWFHCYLDQWNLHGIWVLGHMLARRTWSRQRLLRYEDRNSDI